MPPMSPWPTEKQVNKISTFQTHWLGILRTSVHETGESREEKNLVMLIYLHCCEGCQSRNCRQSNSK